MAPNSSLQKQIAGLQAEFENLQAALKDKGARYFQRPLVLAAIMIFAAYFYIYSATGTMQARMKVELGAARATAIYSEDYESLTMRLDTIKRKLPRTKSPENWLLEAIRRSLKEEGIVPLSTSPPKEVTREGYRFITISVKCQSSFRQIASWISRLERSKKLMYIGKMQMLKENQALGENTATIEVTTVVPKTEEGA